MISVNRRTLYGEVYNDVRCLSSDEKPTEGIKNGSTLIEIDTGARYLFDASNGQWNEFSQGGGGGEGDSYILPTMSASVKGGAKLGSGLTMDGDVLSVSAITVQQVHQITGV
jgi:precorrin-3B methylase